MKRYFYWIIIIAIISISNPFLQKDSKAQNIDEPTITTQIRYGGGAEVTIAYESRYWVGSREAPDPQSLVNNYSEEMAMLQNNVQLQIGPTILEPSIYWIGFMPLDENTWELVIKTQAGEEISRLPIVMRVEPNIVDYLSIVLRPGQTDQDFIMTMLFGTRSTSLRWTITGIPLRPDTTQDLPENVPEPRPSASPDFQGTIPDLGQTPNQSARIIDNATRSALPGFNPASAGFNINDLTKTAPPIKKRAGSGSFRRLMEIYEEEQN